MNLPMFNMKAELVDTSLVQRFGVPPFSVLDARQGYWQERKRAWLTLGIKSELGRGDVMPSGEGSVYSGSSEGARSRGGQRMDNGKSPGRTFGQDLMRGEYTVGNTRVPLLDGGKARKPENQIRMAQEYGIPVEKMLDGSAGFYTSGTSIFDPVLCELVYRWFAPTGGKILDPFAGGSVRGIVAAYTGHHYTGLDLRKEQVLANREQWAEISQRITPTGTTRWGAADSRNIAALIPDKFDLIFSCPPYFDLEQYCTDPADLSNAHDYAAFIQSYRHIWQQCISMLAPNRFAVIVVGDIRDKAGFYRGLVLDTVRAFTEQGMGLYNDAILITSVGSLPLRVGKQFGTYRKLGKSHQNVLVFYKGHQGDSRSLWRN